MIINYPVKKILKNIQICHLSLLQTKIIAFSVKNILLTRIALHCCYTVAFLLEMKSCIMYEHKNSLFYIYFTCGILTIKTNMFLLQSAFSYFFTNLCCLEGIKCKSMKYLPWKEILIKPLKTVFLGTFDIPLYTIFTMSVCLSLRFNQYKTRKIRC